jgi:hypothetical protein
VVEVEIRELHHDEIPFAAGVLARGMRDNPGAVAVYGDDPLRRVHDLEAQFRTFLPASRHPPLVACRTGVIVGVLGMAPPGACQASLAQRIRVAPPLLLRTHLLLRGPDAWLRIVCWAWAWSARHPRERHWHLGPVAVEAGLLLINPLALYQRTNDHTCGGRVVGGCGVSASADYVVVLRQLQ